jgi:hypothetical protein
MIDLSTDEGVRTALREIADWPAGPAVEVRAERPRHRWLAAAAAFVLVAVGITALVARDEGSPASTSNVLTGWFPMAAAPIAARHAPASVWNGEELLVWGGFDGTGQRVRDGAAYDPLADEWRSIAPMPEVGAAGDPFSGASDLAAWAGDRAFTIVRRPELDTWAWDLLAYEPGSNAWQTIDENRYDQLPTDALTQTAGGSPIDTPYSMVGWRDLVVVYGWHSAVQQVGWATFDPRINTWSAFQPIKSEADPYLVAGPPGTWTVIGDRWFVQLGAGMFSAGDAGAGVVVDLVAETSTVLEYPRQMQSLRGWEPTMDASGLVVGMWVDDATIDPAGRYEPFAARYDPVTQRWAEAAPPHVLHESDYVRLDGATLMAVPGGHFLFGGDQLAASEVADPDATAWVRHPTVPFDANRNNPVMVPTAVGLIVWGGSGERDGQFAPLADGVIYRASWEGEP